MPLLSCEQLGALRVPTLVVQGQNTRSAFPYAVEEMLTCLPKTTEVAITPRAPHGWNVANPEDSAKAILAFVGKHSG